MMHRQSFKSLSWLHIHSSLILCSLFPPKLFILSTLCCVFFTSCHSGKRRSRSCRYQSSSCPCFHPPGAAHFLPPLLSWNPMKPVLADPGALHPPDQTHFTAVTPRWQWGLCTNAFRAANAHSGLCSAQEIRHAQILQILSYLHCSSDKNYSPLQQKTTSHLNFVKDSSTCVQSPH